MAYGGIIDAAAEIGRNPASKHQIQTENEKAHAGRDGRTRLATPNYLARTGTDREIFVFPVQLTTSRIGNLTRLIKSLSYIICHGHTYSLGDNRFQLFHTFIPIHIMFTAALNCT